MSGAEQWLIEAIEQRHLVEYRSGGDFLLFEPYIYGRAYGKGEVVVGFLVPRQARYHAEPAGGWRELAVSELWKLEKPPQFVPSREVPPHHRERVVQMYCEAKAA